MTRIITALKPSFVPSWILIYATINHASYGAAAFCWVRGKVSNGAENPNGLVDDESILPRRRAKLERSMVVGKTSTNVTSTGRVQTLPPHPVAGKLNSSDWENALQAEAAK